MDEWVKFFVAAAMSKQWNGVKLCLAKWNWCGLLAGNPACFGFWFFWWVKGGSPPLAPPKGNKQSQESKPQIIMNEAIQLNLNEFVFVE